MQLSARSATIMQRSVATRRSSVSVFVTRPSVRHMGTARTPVRVTAQADSAVGEKTVKKKKTTLIQDVLNLVRAGGAKLLDLADDAPEQVTTLTPEDTKLCIQYATWARAAYSTDTDAAVKMLSDESDINEKLMPSSLVLLSGSSALSERFIFRKVKTDTQALLGLQKDGQHGAELVVAFRGSEKKASDWVTDFLIDMDPASDLVPALKEQDPDEKLQIHAGFMESANDFLTDKTTLVYGHRDATEADKKAFEKLEAGEELTDEERAIVGGDMFTVQTLKDLGEKLAHKHNKRITKLVICGHSLGGALATLTAYWCRKGGWPGLPVDYYSFGAPRVANHEFADEWGKTIIKEQPQGKAFRVMHRNDLVSAIPRADLPIPITSDTWYDRYIHVDGGVLLLQPGTEPMIGNQGNPKRWPELAVDPVNGWQAQQRRRPFSPANRSADDHSLYVKDPKEGEQGYIPALKDALKNYTGKYEPLSG